jgi:sugar lactone lactonase YvrE
VTKWFRRIALGLVAIVVVTCIGIYAMFGGGKPYPDLSGKPLLPNGTIEAAVVSDRPIGNAAVSADGRIFYTIHPESNPVGTKLYEWVKGKPVPYPNEAQQATLFTSPLGLAIDARSQLWVIDPAKHGTGPVRLTAFDLATNKVVHSYTFSKKIAPLGSFLQDLQVSADGRWIYIADVGFWPKRPALIVYDAKTRTARRVLNRHASVYPQNILIRNQIKPLSFFGGLLEMKTGIDGLALSRDGAWLYYGAMNHDTLFRVPTAALQDPSLNDAAIASKIEPVGKKPLNDGLSIDDQNGVFITDVEHQAVLRMTPDGKLATIVKDSRIRWADGLSFGPDGWLYLADSAIPYLVLQNAEYHKAHAPYIIWRFKPGTTGTAGQ